MGNRDKRGREKKKPKKTAIKLTSIPFRPAVTYKPASPPPPEQPNQQKP